MLRSAKLSCVLLLLFPVVPVGQAAAARQKKRTTTERGSASQFEIKKSKTARKSGGVNPAKLKATKTEAALRLFVVDKEKEPIAGIVICLVSPAGKKFYTAATDALGFAEVLVPIGKTYEVVYISLARRDVSARVTVPNKPHYTLKLTMQYARKVTHAIVGLDFRRVILEDVRFATAEAKLTPDSLPRLDGVVEYLSHSASVRIEISGHTDNVGSSRLNQELSQRRANACRDYLVAKGIARNRIQTIGYGDKRPVARNDSDEGRHRNRRIEVREL